MVYDAYSLWKAEKEILAKEEPSTEIDEITTENSKLTKVESNENKSAWNHFSDKEKNSPLGAWNQYKSSSKTDLVDMNNESISTLTEPEKTASNNASSEESKKKLEKKPSTFYNEFEYLSAWRQYDREKESSMGAWNQYVSYKNDIANKSIESKTLTESEKTTNDKTVSEKPVKRLEKKTVSFYNEFEYLSAWKQYSKKISTQEENNPVSQTNVASLTDIHNNIINIINNNSNSELNNNASYINNENKDDNKSNDPIIVIEEVNGNTNNTSGLTRSASAWDQFKVKKEKREKEIKIENVLLNQTIPELNINKKANSLMSNNYLMPEEKHNSLSFLEDSVSSPKSAGSIRSVPGFTIMNKSQENLDEISYMSSPLAKNNSDNKSNSDNNSNKYTYVRSDQYQTSAWQSEINTERRAKSISKNSEEIKSINTEYEERDPPESAWKAYSKKTLEEILSDFDINQVIGKGFNGTIFKGVNKKTKKPVAIKAENKNSPNKHLELEYAIYQRLFGVAGMPNVLYYGSRQKENIMIMELLGPSIESLFNICNRTFSVKTICMIGKQLLSRLEMVHNRGIVYRDIKPENFMIGFVDYSKPISNEMPKSEDDLLIDDDSSETIQRPPVSTVFLADFGLSEFYRDELTGIYVPNVLKPPCGTPRYMSLNTHRCNQQTPRDDVEALGYCLIYFLYGGTLPWMGITASTPEKMIQSIGAIKKALPLEQLCKKYPKQFKLYLEYVRKLDFYDMPDYDYLRGLLDEVLTSEGEIDDGDFDWIPYLRVHQKMELKKMKKELDKEKKKEASYMKKIEKKLHNMKQKEEKTESSSNSTKSTKKSVKSRFSTLFGWNKS